jgi:putative membrane protein
VAIEPAEEHRFTVKVSAESHFAWIRTRLSLERTMLSWIRTAVSLIGFGFTIVQFFERFGKMEGVAEAVQPDAPRYLGIALIVAGSLALAISIWQYWWGIRYLSTGAFRPVAGVHERPWKVPFQSPVFAIAAFVGLIGIFAFVSVFTRLF